jgi:hypothetical protein
MTGFGKLRFKLECEQELWSECSRLIANCIIFYNASILSRLLEHQERIGDTLGTEATKKVAPIAWQNINLQRRFEFHKAPDALNVDAITRAFALYPPASCVRNLSRSARLTGFTRWPSHPASRDWIRSPSWPQPVRAMMMTDRPHGRSRMRRVAP